MSGEDHSVDDAIRFHRLSDPYGDFTGFARYPIVLEGQIWATREHWFQAQKFDDPEVREQIRSAATPRLAARLGHQRSAPIRAGWDEMRVDVMRKGLKATFIQHPKLRNKLVATGERVLVDNTSSDYFWGVGADGSGKNVNGTLLMDLRAELQTPGVRVWLAPDAERHAWVLLSGGVVVFPPARLRRDIGVAAVHMAAELDGQDRQLVRGEYRVDEGRVVVLAVQERGGAGLRDIDWVEDVSTYRGEEKR